MTQQISLYFHLPFCRRKCPYCHFFVLPEKEPDKELLQGALLRHLDRLLPQLEGQKIASVYFGGGTPTLFGIDRVTALLQRLQLDPECEVTIEANPEEVTKELLSGYKKAGINRLSIGVQTLDDALLKTLGRSHTAKKAVEAVEVAHEVGFKNLSIDLMYELPGQSKESFERTLERVGELPLTHLSLYNLTFEPTTLFYKQRASLQKLLPSSEECLEMLQIGVAKLEAFGLKRYEISAFARQGFSARHNCGYWTARPFFGLGPSAFSYFEGRRFRNVCNLRRYSETLGTDFEEKLPFPDSLHELLAVELRLLEGVDLTLFEGRHGSLPEETEERVGKLLSEGFLEKEETRLRLTPKGLLFYDSVAARII